MQMKKSIAVAALSVVSLLGLAALPAFCADNDKTPVSEYCASHGDLGLSHGACVAYFTTHNVAPHDATVCRDPGILGFLGVDNHGQCMKKLADLRK
jgi:hypothetical protein